VKILVLPGDGVGPEVIDQAKKVLETCAQRFQFPLVFTEAIVGGAAIDAFHTPLPDGALHLAQASDAVLFGAVGGPKWDDPLVAVRPEHALLRLRKGLGLFANLRPVRVFAELVDVAPLKAEILHDVDLVVVRELTGGLYFGSPSEQRQGPEGREAVDTLTYTEGEIARLMRHAFELARQRRKKVTCVHKANVLRVSDALFLREVRAVAKEFADVGYDEQLVDSMTAMLVRDAQRYDVIVTTNMFGDILSDEAAESSGSLGPGGSINGGDQYCMAQAQHGSAPDIAGKDIANPTSAILSAAMLLEWLGERKGNAALAAAARAIAEGVERLLRSPETRTRDLGGSVGSAAFASLLAERL
jgi:3-isopropylmalate dehydrogenase